MNLSSSRIQLLRNQLSSKPVLSALEFCFFEGLLTPEESQIRKEVREFAEREVVPLANEKYDQAEFPEEIFEKFGKQGWAYLTAKKPYGDGKNRMLLGLIVMELARVDAGIACIFLLQAGMARETVETLASEEQQKKLLPKMLDFKITMGWALTEPSAGSDASSIKTNVRKTEGGYILNGEKRWIGNGNGDMVVVWAKNQDSKKAEAFFVAKGTPGVQTEVIKNKLALRTTQNCNIRYKDVFIPEENKLPRVDQGFASINELLGNSRVLVAWVTVGVAIGVYDNTIKYINERTQFGVKISSFQLMQEKLSRIMGNIQAMLLMVWRATRLNEAKKLKISQVAMVKAWTTKTCREVAQLGREMMGGNGILVENYAMKALLDIEAIHTFEGTYDINSLILGRELTGIPAFK